MTEFLSEVMHYPNGTATKILNKVPCVVPPPNPLKELMKMITRHTGYTVGFPVRRNGYWEVETIFGRIKVSDLLKTRKGMSLD